jgi:hypothetical protein
MVKMEMNAKPELKPRMEPYGELMKEVVPHIQGLYAAAFKGGVSPGLLHSCT